MASSQASGVNTPPYVDFKRAVELMLDGHPVIFPTETFFALGSRALDADATARVQPPTDKGKRLKIYYMTQASTKPPTFVCFCNKAELFHFSYQRYLENQIRSTFGLEGTPVRFVIRERGEK